MIVFWCWPKKVRKAWCIFTLCLVIYHIYESQLNYFTPFRSSKHLFWTHGMCNMNYWGHFSIVFSSRFAGQAVVKHKVTESLNYSVKSIIVKHSLETHCQIASSSPEATQWSITHVFTLKAFSIVHDMILYLTFMTKH